MASTCPEFKVILCGEYGVGKCDQYLAFLGLLLSILLKPIRTGKTSLFRRFTSHQYLDTSKMSVTQSRQSTLGLDHFSKKFTHDNKTIKIQLWLVLNRSMLCIDCAFQGYWWS